LPTWLQRVAAGHETIPEETLGLVEQLFVTWRALDDDRARRLVLRTLFGTEAHVRAVLLAVVPIYFDPFYFDARTSTHDLVELALVAHRKWRTWREWLARSAASSSTSIPVSELGEM
jgi:hypothetical protein